MSSPDMKMALPDSEKGSSPLSRTESVREAHTSEVDTAGDLHRSFTPRQIHIISLGSNVGSGLFIATGKALMSSGPGTMLLAYAMVCLGVWANLQTLGEMTVAFPTSGNYIDYAGRWVDPALAFGAGFAEWLGWIAVFAAEATFFVVLVDFWAEGSVPVAALISIFIVICLVIFFLPNNIFAWVQCAGSLVKILLFVLIFFLSLALIGGAGPNGKVADGSTWRDGAFLNGFGGFANSALLAIWAMGDQIFIGVMGGEAKSPQYSMGRAAKLIPFRVAFMYVICIIFVGLLVSPDDPSLLGGSGSAASPFVISVRNAGIKGLPDLINVCMIIGIIAIALESIYLPSRILRTMSLQGLLPARFANCDSKGRPRWALAITSVVAIVLSYMSLNSSGLEALNWLISITSASFFLNWMVVAYSNLRFHQAMRAQGKLLLQETRGWRSFAWPFAPVLLLLVSTMLLISLFYSAIKPLGGASFTAENFFLNTIGLILIVTFTIGFKLVMRTKWVDPATADLVNGRHVLSDEEIELLDTYYSRPAWRRVLTYVSLW